MKNFSNYAEQGIGFGRTIQYEVTELRNQDGSHPLLHVEHMGRANASFVEEALARAGSEEEQATTARERWARSQEQVIRHAVRGLERVFFADGSAATIADAADFVRALPYGAFERLFVFVTTESNFCRNPIATPPEALAEK